MRDLLATFLALAVIFTTVWGIITLFILGVEALADVGVPPGVLYFSAGAVTARLYKEIGRWFANYCDIVWEKLCDWIVWR